MKKWLIGFPVLVVLVIASTYIFIPARLTISKSIQISGSSAGINRVLKDHNTWHNWLPITTTVSSGEAGIPAFRYNGLSYTPEHKYYNSFEILISDGHDKVSSRLNIIKASSEATILEWKCQYPTSTNPLTRFNQYQTALRINKNMLAILDQLHAFFGNNANVYGVNIHQVISKDSTLLFTSRIMDTYPGTNDIYALINSLKQHIIKEGALMNNVPMLNVKPLQGSKYEVMVAIPVNGRLKETATIVNRRFVPWKTLVGDVKGGAQSVQAAMEQMKYYIDDYQRNAMGIPFQLLITDRSKETDTLKWITRICQAVS